MIGGKLIGKIIDTLHRLADSRKVVVSTLLTFGAVLTEMLPYLVQWMQLLGVDPARQTRLENTCHAIAATLVLVGQWNAKLFKDEDVALKTTLPPPPPAPASTVVQTGDSPRSTSTVVNNPPKA